LQSSRQSVQNRFKNFESQENTGLPDSLFWLERELSIVVRLNTVHAWICCLYYAVLPSAYVHTRPLHPPISVSSYVTIMQMQYSCLTRGAKIIRAACSDGFPICSIVCDSDNYVTIKWLLITDFKWRQLYTFDNKSPHRRDNSSKTLDYRKKTLSHRMQN